ncbi:hypothetical protein V6N12_041978 [Hibiscus sabdariffa]|uniref:RNase H type-1 domain-containing protein n=1 Tax=Hibiscus sabdariffa TaxID=183260 RepID=A0ABR2EDF7_9ROSI
MGSPFDRKIKATGLKLGKWSKEKSDRHRTTCKELKKRILELQNSPLSKSSPLSTPLDIFEQWATPGPGFVKANVDASVDLVGRKASVAVIFRDKDGRFLGGTSASFIPSSIAAAEAYAVRLGTFVHMGLGVFDALFSVLVDLRGKKQLGPQISWEEKENVCVQSGAFTNGYNVR